MTREEFEQSLNSIFFSQVFPVLQDFEKSIMLNDVASMDDYATRWLRAQGRIDYYLGEWDNAPDQASKDAVAGTVNPDLGTAAVDPNSLYNWPPLGHFGNAYSSGSQDNYNITYTAQVDATTTGNTSIFTVPSGKRFIPQVLNFTLKNVAGLAVVSTCSVGGNASSYNDICSATLLTGLNSQNSTYCVQKSGVFTTIAPDTEVFCKVTIASTASTYDLVVGVSGCLINS